MGGTRNSIGHRRPRDQPLLHRERNPTPRHDTGFQNLLFEDIVNGTPRKRFPGHFFTPTLECVSILALLDAHCSPMRT